MEQPRYDPNRTGHMWLGGREYYLVGGRWVEAKAARPNPRTSWPPEHRIGVADLPWWVWLAIMVLAGVAVTALWIGWILADILFNRL